MIFGRDNWSSPLPSSNRKGFRFYWRWRSRGPGRPRISLEIRDLIRRMSRANPLWGAPRIHGELLKLGIKISQATVGRWMPWRPKVPSPTWRSFLRNHLPDIAAIDMFVVATATFDLLYALIVLSLDRRRIVHFAVTPNPTQDWLSRQMTEAFPWDTAPRYLLRDRDKSYGPAFRHRVRAMGITEVITAPRSPWQNSYAERLIGSIRRECLDHVIIFNERHLNRVLSSYFQYHHDTRTHLSLGKDCPRPRPIQSLAGNILAFPEVGGLHHRYERRAAYAACPACTPSNCRHVNFEQGQRLLMSNCCFSNKDFGHDGSHSARAHEFGYGGQQVDGENEQVNHRYRR